jgi:hypothetical protein
MKVLDEPVVIDRLCALAERFELTNVELAGLTGLSPHTVRVVRLSRAMPRHAHCRRALREFVARNKGAKSKGDLRATVSP